MRQERRFLYAKLSAARGLDGRVGTGLVVVAILSVFYGSAELTSNIASGLIGFLGRTVMMRGEKEGTR